VSWNLRKVENVQVCDATTMIKEKDLDLQKNAFPNFRHPTSVIF